MSTNVLSARDVNTSAPNNGAAGQLSEDEKPKSMEYHRQVLQSRMNDPQAANKYVSPSDDIMSPTTAKLSAMKNKRFMNSKPKSLFAQTSTKSAMAAGLGEPVSKSASNDLTSEEKREVEN